MAKDYVRRGRSPKKPATKKTATAKRKPWRAGLLAILLVGAFGYGLYILNNDPEPPVPVVQQSKPTPKPAAKKELPPP
ncbi:cell division protein FtsN, partial [Vibrio parahaemolyticus]|nr:cell division protein FtsN [Vibrio parahaemolyticus]